MIYIYKNNQVLRRYKEKKYMICINFIRIKNFGLDSWNVIEYIGKYKFVRIQFIIIKDFFSKISYAIFI